MNSRRQFLKYLAGSPALLAQAPPPPNIIFVMADDLGYGDLGCYGQKLIQTPNIDRLAAEGIRFTDAYAGCTVCAPSRSVLMTGKHTGHTSVRANTGGVPLLPEDVTVAEVLQKAGYTTAGFGKWGLGDIGSEGVPWKQGFDTFFGYLHQIHAHYQYPGFLFQNEEVVPYRDNNGGYKEIYGNDMIARLADGFLHEAKMKKKPFFLYLPLTLPHLELLVPADSMQPYDKTIVEDGPYRDKRNHYAHQNKPRTAYAGMVSRVDRYVGKLMETVKELGMEGNTIFFFCSDNGTATPIWNDKGYFNSAGPFRGHKTNFYEGGLRTPMIARWKGRIKPGVNNLPWYFPDVLPTLAELAGAPVPAGIDGISVVPTLLGKGTQKKHDYLYWELPKYDKASGKFADEVPAQAVRMGNWKGVRPAPGAPLELYDLAKDIGEKNNVAARFPAIVKKLEAICQQARTAPREQKDIPNPHWANV
ncbi:MAG: arylsulfatase [Bryobacterales bacterium]|nr:arylsulfatase [Bryobacterales bacterium]